MKQVQLITYRREVVELPKSLASTLMEALTQQPKTDLPTEEQILYDTIVRVKHTTNMGIVYEESELATIGQYAILKAGQLTHDGNSVDAFHLLAETLHCLHQSLSKVHPNEAGRIAQVLERLAWAGMKLCAALPLPELAEMGAEVTSVVEVVKIYWTPDLSESLIHLERLFPNLQIAKVISLKSSMEQAQAERLKLDFVALQDVLEECKPSEQRRLLMQMLGAWRKWFQQFPVQPAITEVEPAIPSLEVEVRHLIARVERALRNLIAEKYSTQFGSEWVRRVENRNLSMVEAWKNIMQRDKSAFESYKQYSPQILEYARFEDLTDLIMAEWALFQPIFDFGYQKKNKEMLYDKLRQIVKVRNPIAHHRSIPENELLRAKVLCTDILLLLDQRTENTDL